MAEELITALTRRAERGCPRGADVVFAAAHRQTTTVEERRPVWRTGPATAFAAAVITLFVIGGALLAIRLLPSDIVSPPVTSTTVPASPIRVEELVWYRVPPNDAVFAAARIDGVTVFDGALVAVGEDANGAAVWKSPDGLAWTRTVLDFAPSDAEPELRKVSPGGPGLVAIGGHTVWTSPDGVAWTPSQQTFERQLEAITQGVPGLVLVGDRQAYTSEDGVEWSAGRCPTCSPDEAIDYLADVVTGGPGLIAVGNFDDPGMGPAYFWTSQDGMSWTRILHEEEVEMESIAVGGPGFVAVGHHDGARVLTSPEGTDWKSVPYDAEVFGDSLMRHVLAAGDGLVALGEWHSGDQGDGVQWGSGWFWGDAQVWTSRDGISWKRVPYDAAVFGEAVMNDAVVFGDRLIVVGESKEGRGEVWVAAAPGSLEIAPTAETVTQSAPTEQFTLEQPSRRESAVAWSPDGDLLITAINRVASIWDAAAGAMVDRQEFDHLSGVTDVEWSPDSTRIAINGEGSESGIYDAATGEELVGELGDRALAWSPDGTRIAVGGAWGWSAILDASTGDEELMLPFCPGPYSWVWAAAWSPDGTRIATTCRTRITVWNAATGDEQLTVASGFTTSQRGARVTDLAWSPDGTWIATASRDIDDDRNSGGVEVWAATTGEGLLALSGSNGGVWAVEWSPDSTRIATANSDGTATIWDAAIGDEIETITGHTDAVTDVAWSPDGTRIATASADGTVKIWEVG